MWQNVVPSMCQRVLTLEAAIKAQKDFFREKPLLIFGSGLSSALDSRLGMDALRDALREEMRDRPLNGPQREEWERVEAALRDGSDLESALDSVADLELLKTVTEVTGRFVGEVDRQCAFRIARGELEWPATRLTKRLVDTLPESDRVLHALTPNYDLLFEYACEFAGVPYTNGFSGGVERKVDWDAVDRSLLLPEQVYPRTRLRTVYKHRKHVRLYKVHGSLNYFFHRDRVIENNSWMWNPPDYAQRVLITPGMSKYGTIQQYRQELLRFADAAIERANQFLFLGYGFNDKHLEEYIRRKLVTQGCRGLVITRDSNERIELLLGSARSLWLVCQETDGNGTRIFNKNYSDWLHLPGRSLWKVAEFMTDVLGG
jgi:hypothetical protein